MVDLKDAQLDYLLLAISQGVDSGKVVNTTGTDIKMIQLHLTDSEVDWKFNASEQSAEFAKNFMALFNIQCIGALDFQHDCIKNLEKMLEAKDHYITFLTENYKAINGEELLKRYHLTSAVQKFDKIGNMKRNKEMYKQKQIWTLVERALKEMEFDDRTILNEKELYKTSDLIKKERQIGIKSEDIHNLSPPSNSQNFYQRENPKIDEDSLGIDSLSSSQHGPQARKRRRIGGMTLGIRKRSSSPVKGLQIKDNHIRIPSSPVMPSSDDKNEE
ncbi:hypothetical protein CAAN1_16S00364 [[Candida] anglica]|uniref:Uncharacterized protein n=1 Tax=[Candida] anglica TaxID=148631 RepID=A0ABP0EF01_9ASCO